MSKWGTAFISIGFLIIAFTPLVNYPISTIVSGLFLIILGFMMFKKDKNNKDSKDNNKKD